MNYKLIINNSVNIPALFMNRKKKPLELFIYTCALADTIVMRVYYNTPDKLESFDSKVKIIFPNTVNTECLLFNITLMTWDKFIMLLSIMHKCETPLPIYISNKYSLDT